MLLAGTDAVYRSTDGGLSWTSLGAPAGRTLASIAVVRDGALGANELGVWVYGGGVSWEPRNAGLVATIATAIAADPADPLTAYASVGHTVFATTNGGAAWYARSELPVSGAEALDLVTVPERPGTVYAAALVYPGPSSGLVLKSTDGARSWKVVKRDIRAVTVAVAPSQPTTVYAGSIREGVFRSADGGVTWVRPSRGKPLHVVSITLDPQHPGTLYAGTSRSKEGGSVYRSTDGAATWTELAGLPSASVSALVVDPHRPDTVYVAMLDTVYRSDDRGASWRRASAGLPGGADAFRSVTALVPDPSRQGVLYAGHLEAGVFVTTDGGDHWHAATVGLPSRSITALAIAGRTTLFAGTFGSGVAVTSLPLVIAAT